MFKADEMSFRTIGKKFGNQKDVDKFRYHAESAFFHLGAQNAHGRQAVALRRPGTLLWRLCDILSPVPQDRELEALFCPWSQFILSGPN